MPVSLFKSTPPVFQPKLQLWLSNENNEGFGHGRVRLFELIDELGSLSKAARALGMSYRAAWGKVKTMEQATGVALVCSQGSKRDGYALTPEGRALMNTFALWYDEVNAYAAARAAVHFPAAVPSCPHTEPCPPTEENPS